MDCEPGTLSLKEPVRQLHARGVPAYAIHQAREKQSIRTPHDRGLSSATLKQALPYLALPGFARQATLAGFG
ncbi:hypothetical protein [Methanoregula boonei]|uniref:hypothetical protein n=1 Tax=Methanoregula boonei TaxID=358766 RepID=UPI00064E8E42|nr:hypothetical protein [Methanoregula boonei]